MGIKIVFILLQAVVIASFLTPIVVEALLYLNNNILPFPYSRIFDRVILVVVLGLILFNRKKLGINDLRKQARIELKNYSHIILGFLISAISGIIILGLMLCCDILEFKSAEITYLIRKSLLIIPLSLLIATVEELFFRGFLLSKLSKNSPFWLACITTSLLYSLVHFVAPDKGFVYKGYSLLIGFEYLGIIIQQIFNPQLIPNILGLVLVGVVLAHAVKITSGSLCLAIGLHAGWIAALKIGTYFTSYSNQFIFTSELSRRYYLVGNYLGWIAIIAVWLTINLIKIKNYRTKP